MTGTAKTILIIIATVLVTLGAVALWLTLAKPGGQQSPVSTPIYRSLATVSEWGISVPIKAGLSGLLYSYDHGTETIDIISPQLKGQPSVCTGQTKTTGELAKITRTTASLPSVPAALQKQVGSYYYVLLLPNGSSCQPTPALSQVESLQTADLRATFPSITAQ
ncbi:MAG TPA: hypothetical protein VLF67_01500 [Candidatus Saccharimonas sp.]|nr:hypothetical protein [Candidatus Saccharimonas sp.]